MAQLVHAPQVAQAAAVVLGGGQGIPPDALHVVDRLPVKTFFVGQPHLKLGTVVSFVGRGLNVSKHVLRSGQGGGGAGRRRGCGGGGGVGIVVVVVVNAVVDGIFRGRGCRYQLQLSLLWLLLLLLLLLALLLAFLQEGLRIVAQGRGPGQQVGDLLAFRGQRRRVAVASHEVGVCGGF